MVKTFYDPKVEERGIEKGIEQGIKQGIEKIKLAIKMIKAGETNGKIKTATELSYEEIEEIRSSILS